MDHCRFKSCLTHHLKFVMKRCCICKLEKPLDEFYRNRTRPDGRGAFCKSCDRTAFVKTFVCQDCDSPFKANNRVKRKGKTLRCNDCVRGHCAYKSRLASERKPRVVTYTRKGYRYFPDKAAPHGYTLEHRFLIESLLGRKLTEKEVVHHINGTKSDNALDNLWLTDKKGHHRAHHSLEVAAFELVRRGAIVFDLEKGEYKPMLGDSQVGKAPSC